MKHNTVIRDLVLGRPLEALCVALTNRVKMCGRAHAAYGAEVTCRFTAATCWQHYLRAHWGSGLDKSGRCHGSVVIVVLKNTGLVVKTM